MRGPDLDGVGARLTSAGLLESLVHPSDIIVSNYEVRLPAGDLEATPASSPAMSPMPPMGTILTLRELRDLIAFLKTLK